MLPKSIKTVVLLFQIAFLLTVLASCKHAEHKTILADGGVADEQIETLLGAVKEVVTGDSLKADNFNHIYFDHKGNMVKANGKYISYGDTVYRKVVYKSAYDKFGKRISLRADYSIYPDSCGCKGGLKWKFDAKGHITESISDQIRFDHFIEYNYDTIGRIKYKNVWGKKDVPDLYTYKYDINGRLTQLEKYDVDWPNKKGALVGRTGFEYRAFDSHNNWIKKTLHFGLFYPQKTPHTDKNTINLDKPSYTVTRKIIYY